VKKLIFVLLDGLRLDTAQAHMGFMSHLVERGLAFGGAVRSELPSLSRPLYETLLTGLPPIEHGIIGNAVSRPSSSESLFDRVRASGGKTAAAAYGWMCELYAASPFDPFKHRDWDDESSKLQHGRFYWEDDYPDTHLLADAESLRSRHDPDFLLIHSMNIDDAGHKHGGESPEYQASAAKADMALALCLPLWRQAGYQMIVTADHGMNAIKFHGGTTDAERFVPLYLWADGVRGGASGLSIPQTQLAGLCCELMEIAPGKAMPPLNERGVFLR
jgi:predicted AlkP superfamily pyrophosphatase or phosphodiesterase